MKTTKQNNSFSGNLQKIEEIASKLRDYPEDFVIRESEEIEKSAKELQEAWGGYRNLIFLLSLIILLVSGGFADMLYNKNNFKNVVLTGTKSELDSIKNIILDYKTKNDTISLSYYTDEKGNIIKYSDVVRERDSLRKRTNQLEDSLRDVKFKLDYAKDTYGIVIKETKQGKYIKYSISSDVVDKSNKELEKIDEALDKTRPYVKKILADETKLDSTK